MDMTPKEKAKELFDKMAFEICDTDAKKCALICIDEIILFSENLGKQLFKELGSESYLSRCKNYDMRNYWQEVKKELEKIII